ncbi:hypothetical protein QL285_024787 [Trifolium repens]|nr:hypothetical protein QL285_024787 [Trifolium repens]
MGHPYISFSKSPISSKRTSTRFRVLSKGRQTEQLDRVETCKLHNFRTTSVLQLKMVVGSKVIPNNKNRERSETQRCFAASIHFVMLE